MATLTLLAVATPTFARTVAGGSVAASTAVRPSTTVGPHAGPNAGEDDLVAAALGVCSAGSEYDLGMGQETGISLEFGVETGVPDQAWMVRMHYDRFIVVHMKVITDEDGGFELRHVDANLEGMDTMHVVATNTKTGEVCDGQLQTEL